MIKYSVVVDGGAERDLFDIQDYIAGRDSPERAAKVIANIARTVSMLENFPNRGSYPQELLVYGNRNYREVVFKPYRIFYRVRDRQVAVVLIADGRRDMRTLLARRLLGA